MTAEKDITPAPAKAVCFITIVFPCDDDPAALKVKQDIEKSMESIVNKQIDFRIMSGRKSYDARTA
jgi:uncharacterized phage-like protein YoqJ